LTRLAVETGRPNDSASPAPKANEDTAKEKFYAEIAKAKKAPPLGVKVNAIVVLRPCGIPYPV
jgi:hypothetical protein